MNQFNKAKVIMLPTEEAQGVFTKERIYPCILKHSWMFDTTQQGRLTFVDSNIRTPTQLQHLYIISDDKIKEGDYCYYKPFGLGKLQMIDKRLCYKSLGSTSNGFLVQPYKQCKDDCKKLIATTDTSLTIKSEQAGNNSWHNPLPQPSQQFITKYIESYNKGEISTDVLVEYECTGGTWNSNNDTTYRYNLKVHPKDNTITIKNLKDSWNREEVIENMWLAYKESNTIFVNEASTRREFDRWITKIL